MSTIYQNAYEQDNIIHNEDVKNELYYGVFVEPDNNDSDSYRDMTLTSNSTDEEIIDRLVCWSNRSKYEESFVPKYVLMKDMPIKFQSDRLFNRQGEGDYEDW